jgi:hypothetical protein
MASPRRRNQPAGSETSASISEQTAKFLSSGGKVQEIPRGVSGQPGTAARKHITISNKS